MSQPSATRPGAAERSISLALASVLALLPLLPTGPEYLGLPAGAWIETTLVMLVVIALASLLLDGRGRQEAGAGEVGPEEQAAEERVAVSPGSGISIVVWAWLAFVVAVVGAATVGLVSENKLLTPVFLAYLWELPKDLLVPMDQATHPLYPARLALTFLEGLLSFLLVWWICQRASAPKRRAMTALTGWVLGFTLTAGFAIVQYVTRFRLHPYWVEVNPNLVRSHSTLDDPNALGSYMVFGLGITLGLVLGWRQIRSRALAKWLVAGAAVLGLLALASTVSRSAWAALPLALILYLASPLPLPSSDTRSVAWVRRLARAAMVLLLVGATIWLAARAWVPAKPGYKPTSMAEAMIATLDPRVPLQDLLEGRFIWWTAGSRMFLEHPIAGVGLGRFPRLLPHYQEQQQIYENAHNLYLQVAAVMGSIGLVAFLFFLATLAATLYAAVTRSEATNQSRALATGLALGVLALLLTCITGNPLLLPSVQILFATGLAVCLVAIGTGVQNGQRRWGLGALVVALISLMVYSVAAFQASATAKPDAPWGYAWGIHDQETDASGYEFRWTSQEAVLYFVPPEGAQMLELIYTAAYPVRDGVPTEVWIQLEDETHTDYRQDDLWSRILLPLPKRFAEGQIGGVLLRVRVDPPLVPAASGLSDDTRHLGIMLRPPRFRRRPESR